MKTSISRMVAILCLVLLAAAPQLALAGSKVAVVVVDIQGDFTTAHKGSLAVKGTDGAFLDRAAQATVRLKALGLPIYATQDWHPTSHMSFASNQKGKKPFQTIKLGDGRVQVLWPDHCVQGTKGAEILLDKAFFTAVVQKGTDHRNDSYSGFRDDGGAKTGLDKLLAAAGVKTIIVYGIATDYCVKATVLHGLQEGYRVVVVQDLCRGVAPKTSQAAWQEMKSKGAILWPTLEMAKVKGL